MKKLSLMLLLLPFIANGQIINTVFGPSDTLSCSGWGSSIAIDHSGNYYISEECNEAVYKVTPSGALTLFAGNGSYGYNGDGIAATAASLYEPMGVAVDASGNVYIADMGNERVRKVNTAGIISTIAGVSGPGPDIGGFGGDGGPATAAQLSQPAAVFVDNIGDVFIADGDNSRIRKILPFGIITTVVGGGASLGDGGPATEAQLAEPIALTMDAAGNMYICDGFGGNRIRKVSTTGVITTVAGTGSAGYNGDGIAATSAQLSVPRGIAMDANGNLFIADNIHGRIRMVDAAGIITTIAGTGTGGFSGDGGISTMAEINSGNVAIDGSGNLIITDFGNRRIRKVALAALGIGNTNNTASVKLYPNPTTAIVNIQSTNQPINKILITNLLGQTVFAGNYHADRVQVNVANLPTGVYFVKVNGIYDQKFLKE